MKKIIVLIALFTSQLSFGQRINESLEILDNQVQEAHYVFIGGDAARINSDIATYLQGFGKIGQTDGYVTATLNKVFDNDEKIATIACKLVEDKEYKKVIFMFLDKNGIGIGAEDLNPETKEQVIYGLVDAIYKSQEDWSVTVDLKNAEDAVDNAEKAVDKLKKSIEKNIKDQEKLGKRIDATPDDLTKLIEEKEAMLNAKLATQTTEEEAVATTTEKIDKQISKSEKAIVKRQKKEKKDSSKLEKKEAELEELTQELIDAKKVFANVKSVLLSKKK